MLPNENENNYKEYNEILNYRLSMNSIQGKSHSVPCIVLFNKYDTLLLLNNAKLMACPRQALLFSSSRADYSKRETLRMSSV